MPTENGTPRYDAALQARTTLGQVEELRAVADELGVPLGVVIRTALRHGLEPARAAIAESIEQAAAGGAQADRG